MADEADIANDRMQAHIDESLSRALARKPAGRKVTLACAHCEEMPRHAGSDNCLRCDIELHGNPFQAAHCENVLRELGAE